MEFKLGGVRVYLSFGFFAVLAAYLLLDQAGRGGGMLAAVAVHEAGHLVAMGVDYITTNILEGTNKAE